MDIDKLSPEEQLSLLFAHGQAGLQKAAELRQRQAQETANMRALAPTVVDALIDGEFIPKEARYDVAKALEDPTTCMKFLHKIAQVAVPKRNANNYDFGSPVKQSSAETTRTPWRFGNSAEIRAKADAAWWGE